MSARMRARGVGALGLVLGGLTLVALILVGMALLGWGPWRTAAAPARARMERLDYPPGTRWIYRLDYRADSKLVSQVGAEPLSGEAAVTGELVLRGLPPQQGRLRVALSFQNVTRNTMTVFGQALLPDPQAAADALIGREAVLELFPRGAPEALLIDPDENPLFTNLIQTLAGELQVQLQDGEAWTAEEKTFRGVAPTAYRVLFEGGGALALHKARTAYPQPLGLGELGASPTLESSFEIALRDGHLETVEAHERLEGHDRDGRPRGATGFTLSLSLLRHGPASAGAPALTLRRVPVATPVASASLEERLLEQQIDGLTSEQLEADLRLHARGGIIPEHNHFLLQAVGLLTRDPSLCAKLVTLFQGDEATYRGRALLLDLLANTGTDAAQAAFLEALRTPGLARDPSYDNLLSRLVLLKTPNAKTAQALTALYRTDDAHRPMTTVVLGSVAFGLARIGQPSEAAPIGRLLEADLQRAKDPDTREALLIGLGNAGLEAQLPSVVAFANDASPRVRRAVASALRKTPTSQAREGLLSLVGDPEPKVQKTALRSLGEFPLDAATLARLDAQVRQGALSPYSYDQLVTLLTPHLSTQPAAVALLRSLLTRRVLDPKLYTRIRGLLGQG
jgi:hypothetical protein